MSQGPRRLVEDPEWGGAFEGLSGEYGKIESLPDDVRGDVAAMIAASVAGAVGIAAVSAAGAAISSASGAGTTATALGSVGTATTAAGAGAAAGSVGAAGAGAAAGSFGAAGGVGAAMTTAGGAFGIGSSVAATGAATTVTATTVAAVTAGSATALGTMGAGSASLAAMGLVPKVIAALSLAGAMTAGGVVVVKGTESRNVPSNGALVGDLVAGVQVGPETVRSKKVSAGGVTTAPSKPIEPASESSTSAPDAGVKLAPPSSTFTNDPDGTSSPTLRKSAASGLAGEVHLLARARAALSVNREQAWTLLNEYQRSYPNGALRAEYETLVRRVQTEPAGAEPGRATRLPKAP